MRCQNVRRSSYIVFLANWERNALLCISGSGTSQNDRHAHVQMYSNMFEITAKNRQ